MVECTFGSMLCWFGAGAARYVGIDKMHTQHVLESIAYNLKQMPNLMAKQIVKQWVYTCTIGLWMIIDGWAYYSTQYWLHIKLLLVIVLIVYHFYYGYLVDIFKADKNTRSDVFYR